MGFPYFTKNSPLKALQDYLFSNILVRATLPKKYAHTTNHSGGDDDDQSHPSPSLVPLPIHLISKSIKDHLPIDHYIMIKSDSGEDDADAWCAVCLSSIEPWQKVRELGNCKHGFHVECLDAWMDEGSETCPVCRAKLLPDELGRGIDPWRSQRMIYLFGEDCAMEDL